MPRLASLEGAICKQQLDPVLIKVQRPEDAVQPGHRGVLTGRYPEHLVDAGPGVPYEEHPLSDLASAPANPLLQLSNLDYHDRAFLPPSLGEVDVTDPVSLAKAITELEREMRAAAKRLEFEQAAALRDRIRELRSQQILPG